MQRVIRTNRLDWNKEDRRSFFRLHLSTLQNNNINCSSNYHLYKYLRLKFIIIISESIIIRKGKVKLSLENHLKSCFFYNINIRQDLQESAR